MNLNLIDLMGPITLHRLMELQDEARTVICNHDCNGCSYNCILGTGTTCLASSAALAVVNDFLMVMDLEGRWT